MNGSQGNLFVLNEVLNTQEITDNVFVLSLGFIFLLFIYLFFIMSYRGPGD